MSAVSNKVMPRSIALWIALREVSRSVRWPKLLQPRPTAETRRPEPSRLRICMIDPVGRERLGRDGDCDGCALARQGAIAPQGLHDSAALCAAAQKNAAPVRRGD